LLGPVQGLVRVARSAIWTAFPPVLHGGHWHPPARELHDNSGLLV
jgi:hypothetical protein